MNNQFRLILRVQHSDDFGRRLMKSVRVLVSELLRVASHRDLFPFNKRKISSKKSDETSVVLAHGAIGGLG